MVNLLRTSQLIERLNTKPLRCSVDEECEAKPTEYCMGCGEFACTGHVAVESNLCLWCDIEEGFEQEQMAAYDPRDYLD